MIQPTRLIRLLITLAGLLPFLSVSGEESGHPDVLFIVIDDMNDAISGNPDRPHPCGRLVRTIARSPIFARDKFCCPV